MTTETQTFAEHYQALAQIAEDSSRGLEVNDIDKLIPMTEAATGHYKALKERINNVRKILGVENEERDGE